VARVSHPRAQKGGVTLGENIANAEVKDAEVILPIDKPHSEHGGLALLH